MEIVIGISTIILLTLTPFAVMAWGFIRDKYAWNGGHCRKCGIRHQIEHVYGDARLHLPPLLFGCPQCPDRKGYWIRKGMDTKYNPAKEWELLIGLRRMQDEQHNNKSSSENQG